MQGPVLQPFAYDESHPYAAGQHRGIDIGADAAGEQVVAPAAGTVSFAGSVPTNGECVTIQTPDGYSVTLTHLGTILVPKGASVAEGRPVGTVGPSGTPEFDRPYVHLGIRTASDSNGYLDPVSLLPPLAAQAAPAETSPAQAQPAATQPAATQPATSSAPASAPAQPAAAPAAAGPPSVATTRGSTVTPQPSRSSGHERPRVQKPRPTAGSQRSSQPPAAQATTDRRTRLRHRRAHEQTSTTQRPVVEATAPIRTAGLDAGHEIQPTPRLVRPRANPRSVAGPLPLALNGAAALVALAAALATRRRKRPSAPARVLHLPRPQAERRAA